jgi:hypothetical protein
MYYSKLSNKTFLIRLEIGEQVISSIKRFCEKLEIKNASFVGIGSVENPILAHYRVDNKKYKEKKLQGIFEVTSLVGNVAILEGKPLVHSHTNVSDEEMHGFGGHLVEATVAATLEMTLWNLGSDMTKKHDEKIGINLFELPDHM